VNPKGQLTQEQHFGTTQRNNTLTPQQTTEGQGTQTTPGGLRTATDKETHSAQAGPKDGEKASNTEHNSFGIRNQDLESRAWRAREKLLDHNLRDLRAIRTSGHQDRNRIQDLEAKAWKIRRDILDMHLRELREIRTSYQQITWITDPLSPNRLVEEYWTLRNWETYIIWTCYGILKAAGLCMQTERSYIWEWKHTMDTCVKQHWTIRTHMLRSRQERKMQERANSLEIAEQTIPLSQDISPTSKQEDHPTKAKEQTPVQGQNWNPDTVRGQDWPKDQLLSKDHTGRHCHPTPTPESELLPHNQETSSSEDFPRKHSQSHSGRMIEREDMIRKGLRETEDKAQERSEGTDQTRTYNSFFWMEWKEHLKWTEVQWLEQFESLMRLDLQREALEELTIHRASWETIQGHTYPAKGVHLLKRLVSKINSFSLNMECWRDMEMAVIEEYQALEAYYGLAWNLLRLGEHMAGSHARTSDTLYRRAQMKRNGRGHQEDSIRETWNQTAGIILELETVLMDSIDEEHRSMEGSWTDTVEWKENMLMWTAQIREQPTEHQLLELAQSSKPLRAAKRVPLDKGKARRSTATSTQEQTPATAQEPGVQTTRRAGQEGEVTSTPAKSGQAQFPSNRSNADQAAAGPRGMAQYFKPTAKMGLSKKQQEIIKRQNREWNPPDSYCAP